MQRGPITFANLIVKRALDLTITVAMLALTAPLLALIAIAIKLDSRGPVLFQQRRKGFAGQSFRIYKFRSMHVLEDSGEVRQACGADARVTRIGRFLRRTSLDELPQLFNILRGDMSLVGPRPHALAHDDFYSGIIEHYVLRHHVKPGITGWAQIHDLRGETADIAKMQTRIDYDLWYITNWSIWLDLKIMLATLFVVVRARNAY